MAEGGGATSEIIPEGLLEGDGSDTAKTHAEKIRDSLSITGSHLILLAVAFTYEHSRRQAEMYPEMAASDTTEKSNREDRPLAIFGGCDQENRPFSHTWAFLPSKSRWVFDWFFGRAVPQLHSPRFCAKLEVIFTDQDGQEVSALEHQSGLGKVFPSAKHGLCAWHKNDRGLANDSSFKPTINQFAKDLNKHIEWKALLAWIWSLSRETETKEESLVSKRLLEIHLEEDETSHHAQLGDAFRSKLATWFSKSHDPHDDKLLCHNFVNCMTLSKCTSSITEQENSVLHRNVVKPQMGMDTAESSINQSTQHRNFIKDIESEKNSQRQFTNDCARELQVLGLSDYSSTMLSLEWLARDNCLSYCVSHELFCVRVDPAVERQPSEHQIRGGVSSGECSLCLCFG